MFQILPTILSEEMYASLSGQFVCEYWCLTFEVTRVTNINFLLTISIHHQEKRLGEVFFSYDLL